jgi:hypothetical protein
MGHWFSFFAGTPQRFLGTVAGLAALYGLFNPDGVGQAVHALLQVLLLAIAPFMEPLLTLGVIIIGFSIALRGLWRRPRGGGGGGRH